MNSAIRLRSMPRGLLFRRQRYSGFSTLTGNFNSVKKVSIKSINQWNCVRLQNNGASTNRYIHSTTTLLNDYPDHEVVGLPALSPTMESGTIAEWAIKEGDSFSPGSVICSVETDKATMDFEAQDDGVLAKILKEGPNAVDIAIGEPICIIVEDESDVAAFAEYVHEGGSESGSSEPAVAPSTPEAEVSAPAAATPVDREVSDEFVLLPSARFLAESKYVFC